MKKELAINIIFTLFICIIIKYNIDNKLKANIAPKRTDKA
jgi:hypothetical protein